MFESEKYYDYAISIPLHPSLNDEDIDKVIQPLLICLVDEKRKYFFRIF